MVVVSAKKNTIVTLTVIASFLVVGYFYAFAFNAVEKQPSSTASTTTVLSAPAVKDYFEEYRLERDKARSRQIELLKEIVNNTNSSTETRRVAQQKLLNITEKTENEVQIENILIARGFNDAVVFIQPESITVVVKGEALVKEDENKVKEAVSQISGISNEDITVMSRK